MLNPRIDIPLDALGDVIDSAAASAGQLTESVGDLSEAVASQVGKVIEETRDRRFTFRHVVVAVVALGVVAGVVMLIRRSSSDSDGRQAGTRDAGAASPN